MHARGQYPEDIRFRNRGGAPSNFPSRDGTGGGEADAPRDARLGGGSGDLESRRTSGGATGRPRDDGLGGLFGAASTMISQLLLVVVGVALVVLVGFVIVALMRRRHVAPDEVVVARPARRDRPNAASELLVDPGDPDALAAEGRYAEAILALLIRALRLAGWQPDGQRSRTAREVLYGIDERDPRRAPLDHVVRRAERARFAGDPPTEALYREVREGYEALRQLRGNA